MRSMPASPRPMVYGALAFLSLLLPCALLLSNPEGLAFQTSLALFSGNSVLTGPIAGWALICCCLSLKGGMQWLYAWSCGEAVLTLRHTLGLLHLDLGHRHLYSQTQALQIGSISVGLMTTSSLALYATLSITPRLLGAALLAQFIALAPMLMTDGARLLELLGSHRQRLRTDDFLRQNLLRTLYTHSKGRAQESAIHLSAALWFTWLIAATMLLNRSLFPAILQTQTQLLGLRGSGFFLAALLMLTVLIFTALIALRALTLAKQMLLQLRPHHLQPTGSANENQQRVLSELLGPNASLSGKLFTLGLGQQTLLPSDQGWVLIRGKIEAGPPVAEGGVDTLLHLSGAGIIDLRSFFVESPLPIDVVALEPSVLYGFPINAKSDNKLMTSAKDCSGFTGFSELMLARLLWTSESSPFHQNEVLLTAGNSGSKMALITSGSVYVELTTGVVELTAGELIGEIGVLYGGPRNATVRGAKEGSLCWIDRAELLDALAHFPSRATTLHHLATARNHTNLEGS